MSKRKRSEFDEPDGLLHGKKVSKKSPMNPASGESNLSCTRLIELSSFSQEDPNSTRHNIRIIKIFLESIIYSDRSNERDETEAVLLQYLKPLKDGAHGEIHPLSGLLQAWTFAAHSHHEALLSAIPAVFALLLKTISSLIAFRDIGIQICLLLLKKDYLLLFDHNLSSRKLKELHVSPCLRLLTEIVSFDGGALAKRVFAARDLLYKNLDSFLLMGAQDGSEVPVEKRKPTIRHNAVRFLLTNFRYQGQPAKANLISQGKCVAHLFQTIGDDPPSLVIEILTTVVDFIARDVALDRNTKHRFFTEKTLSNIAELYHYGADTISYGQPFIIQEHAHRLLLMLCTLDECGVLVNQLDWFASGSAAMGDGVKTDDDNINEARLLDQGRIQDSRIPNVHNTTIAKFLQNLRPYSNSLERELVIAALRAAPELVADYFFRKRNFSFDPKFSTTWLGYAAFIYCVIGLPIPTGTWREKPPPISIIIESFFPLPLTRRSLTKCIHQKNDLLAFSAVRLLLSAFQKLGRLLSDVRSETMSEPLWNQFTLDLKSEFRRRCPDLKLIITAYQRCPWSSPVQREALLRLLNAYYRLLPEEAMVEKFDVSIPLIASLQSIRGLLKGGEVTLEVLGLDSLLDIAHKSPDTRWWQQPETLPYSPFTIVLEILTHGRIEGDTRLKTILRGVSQEHSLFSYALGRDGLDALISSLKSINGSKDVSYVYHFVDNCILRGVRQAMKYEGDRQILFDALPRDSDVEKDDPGVDIFSIVLMDQWSFCAKSANRDLIDSVLLWITSYIRQLALNSERHRLMKHLCKVLAEETLDDDRRQKFEADLQHAITEAEHNVDETKDSKMTSNPLLDEPIRSSSLEQKSQPETFATISPYIEDENHTVLHRWNSKDIVEAVEDGTVGEICICLCSEYYEIRKQALSAIRIIMDIVKESNLSEKQTIYLLLGELYQSAAQFLEAEPYPYFAGAFTARALAVINEPQHFMFPRINKFLNKAPEWRSDRLPAQWLDQVLLHPPEEDVTHDRELQWVLGTLIDGLRTSRDMDQYRQCKVLEKMLSAVSSPACSLASSELAIQLIVKGAYVDPGAAMITRSGVFAWLKMRQSQGCMSVLVAKELKNRLMASMDHPRIIEWTGRSMDFELASA
ncbi:hypothetical protein MMC25_007920 [Agyrium rufum]|nr:hypothetical protein [Agyrium rufum]